MSCRVVSCYLLLCLCGVGVFVLRLFCGLPGEALPSRGLSMFRDGGRALPRLRLLHTLSDVCLRLGLTYRGGTTGKEMREAGKGTEGGRGCEGENLMASTVPTLF